MFDPRQFDDIAKKLFASLPESVQTLERDMQQKFKDVLQSAFQKMDLVTREEFDVQVKVLERTREKLEQLEHALNELQKTPKKASKP